MTFLIAVLLQAESLSQQGAAAMRAGQFEEAARIYRELAKSEPNQPGWTANLGLALHSQAKYREAAAALERSLKLKPSPDLSLVLGVSYLKLGEACRAVVPLERAQKPEPLADALMGCKRYSQAAALYEKLKRPRLAGQAWWEARQYDKAKASLSSVAAEFANDPEFNYEYGDTLLRIEGAEASLPYLEKSTAVLSGRAALGKAYAELGRNAEAIPHLEATAPVDPTLLLPLSRAYKATGRAADAERALADYKKKVTQNSILSPN